MTRKLWVLSTVTLFGVSAVLVGVGLTRNAAACDDAKKTAAVSTASSSCCAKDGTSSASVDAKKVHHSIIKSAVVAPGAAPILNIAAFGGMLASGNGSYSCDWCPEMSTAAVNAGAANAACMTEMTAAQCAAKMTSAECAAKMSTASVASAEGCAAKMTTASVASADDCCASKAAKTASVENSNTNVITTASLNGTSAPAGTIAGGDGCNKSSNASAAGHSGDKASASCCDSKTASAAGSGDKCATAKTASLKGKVDEMPFRENKRVVIAGSYACGHCTLNKTEDCAPMLKTADGKVYPLTQNNLAMDMKSKEGKNLEVSASVKKVDGVKYLDVKSYKVM